MLWMPKNSYDHKFIPPSPHPPPTPYTPPHPSPPTTPSHSPNTSSIEVLLKMPPHTNHRLRTPLMPMYRHHRPQLNRIQHPLTPILRRIPQIQIHPPLPKPPSHPPPPAAHTPHPYTPESPSHSPVHAQYATGR